GPPHHGDRLGPDHSRPHPRPHHRRQQRHRHHHHQPITAPAAPTGPDDPTASPAPAVLPVPAPPAPPAAPATPGCDSRADPMGATRSLFRALFRYEPRYELNGGVQPISRSTSRPPGPDPGRRESWPSATKPGSVTSVATHVPAGAITPA